ncbi:MULTISPECIES: hypothetical protein [unclassified Lysinibacillus]|uniref:hypothetical protein n=1 Tax=unclassified Lysinibacillus TaxID=2636778 RepID=UPI0030F54B2F
MTCYENSVNTSQGKRAKLFVCARNNGINVDVSLRGQPGEDVVIRGYVQLVLEEANQYDAWVEVSSQNEGLWKDSTIKDKTARIFHPYYPGKSIVRVIVKIYSDANYKYLIGIASTNAFVRQ